MDMANWVLLAIGGVVLGAGLVLVLAGRMARRVQQPFADGTTTTAEVVEHATDVAIVNGQPFHVTVPVYSYRDATGATMEGRDQVALKGQAPAVGDRVEISYRPSDPTVVRRKVAPSRVPGVVAGAGLATMVGAFAIVAAALTI